MSIRPYILRLVWQNAPGFIAVTIIATLYQGGGVVTGLFLKAIFDAITGDAQVGFDVYTLIAFFAAFNSVSLLVFQNGIWNLNEFLRNLVHGRLQRNLLSTILTNRPQRPGLSPGEMLNRFRDDVAEAVEPVFLATILLGSAIGLVAGIYVMARSDPAITLVALIPGVSVFAVTKILGTRIDAFRRLSRQATGRVSGSLGEFLGAVQVLQVAHAEERARDHFDRLSDRRRRADLKEGIVDGLIVSLNGGVVTIMTGVVLLAAARLMRTGSFTVGDFDLFVSIVGTVTMTWTLQRIGAFIVGLRRARVSLSGWPKSSLSRRRRP